MEELVRDVQALVVSITTGEGRDALPGTAQLEVRGSQRLPEFDALRGLMLMLMTHLPTQAQVVTNQQLGSVSEAEAFVFL
jgi:hypothetical protein